MECPHSGQNLELPGILFPQLRHLIKLLDMFDKATGILAARLSVFRIAVSLPAKSSNFPIITFPQTEHLQAIFSFPLSIPFPQAEHFNNVFPAFSGLSFNIFNFFNFDRFTLKALPHSVHFQAILSLSEITDPHLLHFSIVHFLLSIRIQINN